MASPSKKLLPPFPLQHSKGFVTLTAPSEVGTWLMWVFEGEVMSMNLMADGTTAGSVETEGISRIDCRIRGIGGSYIAETRRVTCWSRDCEQ